MPLLRTIGGRVRSFRMIHRAVVHHGPKIAELLEGRVNALLPEDRRIDFWLYMLAIVDLLRLSCDRLTGAEHVLVGERGNDARQQRDRDRNAVELRSDMRIFRNAFETNYLPANVEEFGFPTVLEVVPFEVLRQADYLVETMSQPGLVIPEPQVGSGLPIGELVAGIKSSADRLRWRSSPRSTKTTRRPIGTSCSPGPCAPSSGFSPWRARRSSRPRSCRRSPGAAGAMGLARMMTRVRARPGPRPVRSPRANRR